MASSRSKLAAANKITITDGERDALIKNSNLAGLLNVPSGRPIAYDVADQQIVAGKLGSEAYLAAVAKEPVTLNPRFGVLDPNQKTIINDKSASLAKPVATPDAIVHVALPELERLVDVMARLRHECPWDAQQTHRSLVQYLVEETAETIEAIEIGRPRSSSRGAR
mgnify:CR=1 FL=1